MYQTANYTERPPVFDPVDLNTPNGMFRYNFDIKREDVEIEGSNEKRESWTCREITVPCLDASYIKDRLINEVWTQGEREALVNNYNAAQNGQADAKHIKLYEAFNRERKRLKMQVDKDLREYFGQPRTLSDAIAEKQSEIEDYDTGESVNSFAVNGVPCWIDAKMRAVYRGIIETAKTMGATAIGLSLGDMLIPSIPTSMAEGLLMEIEYYAYNAAMVTAHHKLTVSQLDSIGDVDSYDITSGYPERLTITI